MKRLVAASALSTFLIVLSPTSGWAQATAELGGRVTDESNAVLPGVSVTATQTDTGATRSVVTDGSGTYSMPNLAPGPYRLEVSLQGFRTYVQTGIVLQVGAAPTVNVSLAVGNLEETVSVEAAAPLVDVRSAGISSVVENERIVELPLQGRQVTDLIVLAGAAVQTSTAGTRSMQGGVGIAVAGGLSFGVAYLLDGATHNDPQNNLNLPLPFPDALQEFSVATSGLSAQNGMHSGASVSAVTKSGTNAMHGNVFEFLRDRHFNATSRFSEIQPDGSRKDDGLKRNQYGGTLGGPIVRDRLFFFGGYQGTNLRQVPADLTSRVPTPATLRGDFTALASPACNGGRTITLRAPFVNNQVDPALFSRAAVNLASKLPAAGTDPCGDITYSRADNSDEWQAVGRIDYQLGSDHSIFARYMATSYVKPSAFEASGNVLTTTSAGLDNLAQSVTAGQTLVPSPNMVNALRVAFNRTSVHRASPDFFEGHDIGSRVFNYSPARQLSVTVTGGFTLMGQTQAVGLFNTNSYQVNDDLTLVKGNHQLAVGANLAYWKLDFTTHARSGGSYTFNGQIFGLGMADFLMGRVQQLEHGGPVYLPMDMWYLGTFAQDTWRASSRVTINAGVRWEPYFGQRVLRDHAPISFSLDNFRNDVRSTIFNNAPAGPLFHGDPGFEVGKTGLNTQWWNLSPRMGVAWDVTGDGRTSIRSSYGLGYDFQSGEYHQPTVQNSPFGQGTLLEDPAGGMDDPYRSLGGDPHPLTTNPDTPFLPYQSYAVVDPDINSPRVQSWNVTVERQLGTGYAISVSYLGSYSDHLWWTMPLNPGMYLGTGPCTLLGVAYPTCTTTGNIGPRRRLSLSGENPAAAAKIGVLDLFTDISSQEYRGLKLTFQRRSPAGVSINGNYTLSRCYGDNTSGGFLQAAAGFTDPDHPEADRGYCEQDRTHLASLTVGVQTPEAGTGAMAALISNWRASGIITARSGSRLNVTSGRDGAFNGQSGQRPNQISDDVYGDTLSAYLIPTAFAQPAPGTLGDYVRNSLVGPAFWSIDLALSRNVSLGVGRNLELRAEAFNLLNHFNWGNPGTNLGAGTFGRIQTQSGAPRIMQFGVKFGF